MVNIVWAYATVGHKAPELFAAVSEKAINELNSFNSQAMANTVWAYATVGHKAPELFDAVSERAIYKLDAFNSQAMVNTVWAYATLGHKAPELFNAVSDKAILKMDTFNSQGMANTVWAYAVMNTNYEIVALIFSRLLNQYNSNKIALVKESKYQIHQALLCYTCEHGQTSLLPKALIKDCLMAFASQQTNPSKLQKDVVATFQSLGYVVNEEVLCTKTGYSIDAVIILKNSEIAVEVDGPSHFIGYKPTGSTILKHRQLRSLGNRPLLVIPYWEWYQISYERSDRSESKEYYSKKKKKYLQKALFSIQHN